jgi:alanine dehydrogenase
VIGIRREDKSPWETRVPLVPEDIRRLVDDHDIAIEIEGSAQRACSGDAYRHAGVRVINGAPPTRPLSA